MGFGGGKWGEGGKINKKKGDDLKIWLMVMDRAKLNGTDYEFPRFSLHGAGGMVGGGEGYREGYVGGYGVRGCGYCALCGE